jgi:hypothetical protein
LIADPFSPILTGMAKLMKIRKILVLLPAVLIWGCASKPEKIETAVMEPETAERREPRVEDAAAEEPMYRSVRDVYDRFEAAWKAGDAGAYCDLYAEDYMAGYTEDQLFISKADLDFSVRELFGLSRDVHQWNLEIDIQDVWTGGEGRVRALTRQRQFINGEQWQNGPGPETVFIEGPGGLHIFREYNDRGSCPLRESGTGSWEYVTEAEKNGLAYQLTLMPDEMNNLRFTMEQLVRFQDDAGQPVSGWIAYGEYTGVAVCPEDGTKALILAVLHVRAAEFDFDAQMVFGAYGPRAGRRSPEFKEIMYRLFPPGSNIYNPAFLFAVRDDRLVLSSISDKKTPAFPSTMNFRRIR